MRDISGYLE
nr:unnamed protein product [Callosobruchus chinensis]